MRVLLTTPYYYPIVGGTETVVSNIARCLKEIGIFADIATLNPSWQPSWKIRTKLINGVKVFRIPAINPIPRKLQHNKIFYMIDYIPVGYRTLAKAYDILHFHNDESLCFPFFSYSINKPKIFHCHCLNMTYPIYKRNVFSRNVLKKSADIFVVVSKWMVKQLIDLGVTSERIRVVYNGIDPDKFHPRKVEKRQNTILFVGRMSPAKGLSILLKALLHLNHPPVSLRIVGPNYDDEYAKTIINLSRKVVSLTKNDVEFMGILSEEELIRMYQEASLVVMPSLSEPFGIVALEAMSCETPVIASLAGGIPEFIGNERNGLLVPPNNYQALAQAIERLLKDDQLRLKFGREGRRTVEAKFTTRKMIDTLLALYGELIDGNLVHNAP